MTRPIAELAALPDGAYVSVAEAAALLGVSTDTARRAVRTHLRQGESPAPLLESLTLLRDACYRVVEASQHIAGQASADERRAVERLCDRIRHDALLQTELTTRLLAEYAPTA